MVRGAEGDVVEHVLVLTALAATPPRPARRRRRRRPRRVERDAAPPAMPLTRVTVVRVEPLGDRDRAAAWLREVTADPRGSEELVREALGVVNRALHARRIAAQDPYQPDADAEHSLAVRIGFGSGDDVAEGRWIDAVELPADPRRRSRTDALRPDERLAALLGGLETAGAGESLLLRARADLDAGRRREAALQLHAALEPLLLEAADAPGQEEDLALLRERRPRIDAARQEAIRADLSAAHLEDVAETLRICERVLRRRAIGGEARPG